MKPKEIESLLRRGSPRPLPSEWKEQILASAFRVNEQEKKPLLPSLAWSALATCWAVIFLLHATTPVVPQGTIPFDPIAYEARAAVMEQLACLDEYSHQQTLFREPHEESDESHTQQSSPSTQEPLRLELRYHPHTPHSSQLSPSIPNA